MERACLLTHRASEKPTVTYFECNIRHEDCNGRRFIVNKEWDCLSFTLMADITLETSLFDAFADPCFGEKLLGDL